MGALPPPIPGRKNIRFARMMNVMLPGSGLFYLGWRKSGLLLAVGFSICFLGLVGIFVVGYTRYLSIALGDDLMKGNNLNRPARRFITSGSSAWRLPESCFTRSPPSCSWLSASVSSEAWLARNPAAGS